MRLYEKYRPTRLSDVAGQPGVAELASFVSNPYSSCWLFEGPGGTGKTTCAFVLAAELGADKGWPGLTYIPAAELGVDTAKEVIRYLKCGFLCPPRCHWHMAIVEELSNLSEQCLNYLKVGLEVELGERAVVIATSNGTQKIAAKDMWFLQRFQRIDFMAGEPFASACTKRLEAIWKEEKGGPIPDGFEKWGESGGSFSMRLALDRMQQYILRTRSGVPGAKDVPF